MKTLEEQYKIQYNEIKRYWKKKRNKRAAIFAIFTIISVIITIYTKSNSELILIKYPAFIITIAMLTCTVRELIIPLKDETKELKQLEKIYNEERFKERNG